MGLHFSFNDTSKNAKGTANAADVRSGKTFSNDTQIGISGTATDRTGVVITPSTADQAIPAGIYDGVVGDGKVLGDANLVAGNILTGKSIFGIAGNVQPKQIATGTDAQLTGGTHTISGLPFTPDIVVLYTSSPNNNVWQFECMVSDTYSTFYNGGTYAINAVDMSNSTNYGYTSQQISGNSFSYLQRITSAITYNWVAVKL